MPLRRHHRATRRAPRARARGVKNDTRRARMTFSSHLAAAGRNARLGPWRAPKTRRASASGVSSQQIKNNNAAIETICPYEMMTRRAISPLSGAIFLELLCRTKKCAGDVGTPGRQWRHFPRPSARAGRGTRFRTSAEAGWLANDANRASVDRSRLTARTLRATPFSVRRSRGIDKPALQARREATDSAPPRDERPARARCRARRGPWCTSTTGRRARRGAGLAV